MSNEMNVATPELNAPEPVKLKIHKNKTLVSITLHNTDDPKVLKFLDDFSFRHSSWESDVSWRQFASAIRKTQDITYVHSLLSRHSLSSGNSQVVATLRIDPNGTLYKDAYNNMITQIKEINKEQRRLRDYKNCEQFDGRTHISELREKLSKAKALNHWTAVEMLCKEFYRRELLALSNMINRQEISLESLKAVEVDALQKLELQEHVHACKLRYEAIASKLSILLNDLAQEIQK